MPAVSEAQRRWLYTEDAKEKLGPEGQKEWQQSSAGLKLPERKHDPEHGRELKRRFEEASRRRAAKRD